MKFLFFLVFFVSGSYSFSSLEDVWREGDIEQLVFKKNWYTSSLRGRSRSQLLCIDNDDFCEKYAVDSVTCNIAEWKTLPDIERQIPFWNCRWNNIPNFSQEVLREVNTCCKWYVEKPDCESITDPPDGRYLKGSCSLKYRFLHKEHPILFNGTHYKVAERTRILKKDFTTLTLKRNKYTLGRRHPEVPQINCENYGECPEEIECTRDEKESWSCRGSHGHIDYDDNLLCENWGDDAIVEGSCEFTMKTPQLKDIQIIRFIMACVMLLFVPCSCFLCCCCAIVMTICPKNERIENPFVGHDTTVEEYEELNEKHEKEYEELNEKHEKEYEELENRHGKEDKELEKRHEKETEELENQGENEKEDLENEKEELEKEDEELEKRHENEKEDLENQDENEKEDLEKKEDVENEVTSV